MALDEAKNSVGRIPYALEVTELRKSFFPRGNEIKVLDGINFSVEKGKVVVITGKSGTGKSTLLTILGGIERQDSGTVILDGQHLEELSNEQIAMLRRQKVGIIFQNFNLLHSWTAFENVEAVFMHRGILPSERRTRVESLLRDLGLADRMENLPAELSVGQQQRVAVARTLANDPTLILADEPTGDVDSETAEEIINHLMIPIKQKGATLVVATHGSFPLKLAQSVFLLKDGKLSPG